MAAVTIRKRLTIVTVVYWVMLAYIVVALVFWFFSLQQQNRIMTALRLSQLQVQDPQNAEKRNEILDLQRRKTAQYIGEGSIFLLLIMISAVYIFRTTRRQLRLGQQQQNFMMAVTHELKTPIAITTLNLETLQKRRLEEDRQQRLITSSLQETARLNDLCNNILLAAQLEGGNTRLQKEELDLSEMVKHMVQGYRQRFPARSFHLDTASEAMMMGEAVSIQMLINNLLENAVKYSPKEAPITVSVIKEKKKVCLRVKDEGPGIAEEEKKKVFAKFYRIGDERTRTSKGTGLGLYLCKKIVQNHRAEIRLTDNEPQGSIFTVTFTS